MYDTDGTATREQMMSKIKAYTGDGITVHYEVARCIHAAECVRGLPAVFDPQARPWIQPLRAAADEVVAAVARCPTGALRVEHGGAGSAEAVPDHNEVRIVADGPLYLRGDLELRAGDGTSLGRETRAALCRCGASQNKPYCDNSHVGVGFKDDGGCVAAHKSATAAAGPLVVTATANGPLQCDGPATLFDAFGDPAAAVQQTWLCRCGQSANKPYCDGSHRRVGFSA